mmetsp:Transcript_12344/g.19176  ORF Transcript_12344/g.19176 Transcript_12344/m.19176 type:complete len:141 (-) Transcript_12344:1588-2010(-)
MPIGISEEEENFAFLSNIEKANISSLEYLFALQSVCLIFRMATNLEFVESIGPLIKILGKMSTDLVNFCLLYIVLTLMFTLLGNINYLVFMPEYEGFFNSLITVVDASIGKYSFKSFEATKEEFYIKMGHFYLIVVVITF